MHSVYFVDDDELPVEQDFLLIDLPNGGLAFHRASAVCPKHLEDSWAAWRALTAHRRRPRLSVASAS
jgi:hypothetical protein